MHTCLSKYYPLNKCLGIDIRSTVSLAAFGQHWRRTSLFLFLGDIVYLCSPSSLPSGLLSVSLMLLFSRRNARIISECSWWAGTGYSPAGPMLSHLSVPSARYVSALNLTNFHRGQPDMTPSKPHVKVSLYTKGKYPLQHCSIK